MNNCKQLDVKEVEFDFSTIKPFHGRRLIALYNTMTSKGRYLIVKHWNPEKVAGFLSGMTVFPPEDKFLTLYSG